MECFIYCKQYKAAYIYNSHDYDEWEARCVSFVGSMSVTVEFLLECN